MGNLNDINIDLDNLQKAEFNFDPLPEGEYKFIITECERKTSQKGTDYINAKLEVASGEYVNRSVYVGFNLWHSNEKVKNVSTYEFGSLYKACGLAKISDTAQLIDKIVMAKAKLRKEKRDGVLTGNLVNQIFDYQPVKKAAPKVDKPKAAPAAEEEADGDEPF
jgi:hypothetical protein